MDEISSSTICILDNGLFVSWAEKLAQSFGRTLYYSPWKSAFPRFNQAVVGQNLTGVERVYDFWDAFPDVDIFCFPDIYDGDLQQYLRSLGKPVWGGGKSEDLEIFRWQTKQTLKKLGLPVQPVAQFTGLKALRKHLKGVSNKYVKIDRMRGSMETFHHEDYQLSEPRLNELEHSMGAAAEEGNFIVEDAIDNAVEAGYDGYCIDGKFADIAMQGYEIKDAGLIGAIKAYDELPEPVRIVNESIAPTLLSLGCRGFFSTEVRVQKDGEPFLTDPCCRAGSPPNELYQEVYSNWPEIIWGGAHGELIEPKPVCKFGVEVMIHSTWADKNWEAVYYPEKVAQWVKLRNMTRIGDVNYVAPQDVGLPEIGAVIGIGDTLLEAIKHVKENASEVEGYQIEIRMDSIVTALDTIREGDKLGMTFSDDPLPTVKEVAVALE